MENIETECKHILHLLNNLLDVYRLNESRKPATMYRSTLMICWNVL